MGNADPKTEEVKKTVDLPDRPRAQDRMGGPSGHDVLAQLHSQVKWARYEAVHVPDAEQWCVEYHCCHRPSTTLPGYA